jgi:Flp pilus assembly protein TadD
MCRIVTKAHKRIAARRRAILESVMGNAKVEASSRHLSGRPLAIAATMSVALLLGACSQGGEINLGLDSEKPKTSDIATASAAANSQDELAKATAYWADQHSQKPRDATAAISYARNLKAMGRKPQALQVLQGTYMFAADNREFLSEYGRLALELGQISTADQLLARAEDPAKPDWKITSARGTVLAKQGRFKEAITLYERAREIAPPGQASILNNLALAYTMDGQAARGEELLGQAAGKGLDDARVQQNLALVRELQGKPEGGSSSRVVELAAAPGPGTHAPVTRASWNEPLPIEAGQGPGRAAAKGRPATAMTASASAAADPDDIVRRAMAAEQSKASKR